jgi:hypothetical protein
VIGVSIHLIETHHRRVICNRLTIAPNLCITIGTVIVTSYACWGQLDCFCVVNNSQRELVEFAIAVSTMVVNGGVRRQGDLSGGREEGRGDRGRGGIGEEGVEVLDGLLILVEVLIVDTSCAIQDRERRDMMQCSISL